MAQNFPRCKSFHVPPTQRSRSVDRANTRAPEWQWLQNFPRCKSFHVPRTQPPASGIEQTPGRPSGSGYRTFPSASFPRRAHTALPLHGTSGHPRANEAVVTELAPVQVFHVAPTQPSRSINRVNTREPTRQRSQNLHRCKFFHVAPTHPSRSINRANTREPTRQWSQNLHRCKFFHVAPTHPSRSMDRANTREPTRQWSRNLHRCKFFPRRAHTALPLRGSIEPPSARVAVPTELFPEQVFPRPDHAVGALAP